MKRSKDAFPLVFAEAVIAGIPEEIENLEAFKDEIVQRSLREDRWQKKLPPTAEDLRNGYKEMIYELCMARQVSELVPHTYADKLWAISAAISFLEISGFPPDLIKPLKDLMGELEDLTQAKWRRGKSGRPPMSFNELVRGACAAAAVTALSQKGNSVHQALQMVCKKSGLDRDWLRNFRLNILRGNSDARASKVYSVYFSMCGDHRPDTILKSVY
jgi:hypothetical protein